MVLKRLILQKLIPLFLDIMTLFDYTMTLFLDSKIVYAYVIAVLSCVDYNQCLVGIKYSNKQRLSIYLGALFFFYLVMNNVRVD